LIQWDLIFLGIFFGGQSVSRSVQLLEEFFSRSDIGLINAEKFVFIDVHTGLGPSGSQVIQSYESLPPPSPGIDTMMVLENIDGATDFREKYFPTGELFLIPRLPSVCLNHFLEKSLRQGSHWEE
jgi:hypothetical protein